MSATPLAGSLSGGRQKITMQIVAERDQHVFDVLSRR
jgi:hypothetical protein